jgi:Flp pilus assembly protein TadB
MNLFIRLMFSMFVWFVVGLVCLVVFPPLVLIPLFLAFVDILLVMISSSRQKRKQARLEERRHQEMLAMIAGSKGN